MSMILGLSDEDIQQQILNMRIRATIDLYNEFFIGRKVKIVVKESNPPERYLIQTCIEKKYFFGLLKKEEVCSRYILTNNSKCPYSISCSNYRILV
jgi:hypothetical protein